MERKIRKYVLAFLAMSLCCGMVFGVPLLSRAATRSGSGFAMLAQAEAPALPFDVADPQSFEEHPERNPNAPQTGTDPGRQAEFPSLDGVEPIVPTVESQERIDPRDIPPTGRFLPEPGEGVDTILVIPADTVPVDSLIVQSDSSAVRRPPEVRNFLDHPLTGSAQDSVHINLRSKKIFSYGKGEVIYQDKQLNADVMEVDLATKNIEAYGMLTDTTTNEPTRPEFIDGGSQYTMEGVTYNLGTEKAFIMGTATQQGDGYLIAEKAKKMDDGTIFVQHGKYTTCEDIEHPHFYLSMSKAKMIPGKKAIIGPTYFVMEDVPIPFLGIPFGFFPLSMGRSSGFIVPSYGEESRKGFFLRNGGYYFAISDYVDVTATGGFYTLGSWEAKLQSRYIRKYKYSGSLAASYSRVILGDKGSEDYTNTPTMSLQWSHRQDSKFKPNTNFSASVNFSSTGYNKYGSNSFDDYLNTQTNSSITYTKSWAGTPFTFATDMRHSQNSKDSTISVTFPNITFSMTTIYPFKRKMRVGKERWYEKISIRYTGNLTNSVPSIKQDQFFDGDILKKMNNGIKHSIPISTSFNFFNYLNFSPSVNYNESWSFRKVTQEWSPELNSVQKDTTYGFYRSYSYSVTGSFNTKIYGEFQFKGENPAVKAIRHVMTPKLSFSYSPDFLDPRYGFMKPYQSASDGTVGTYNPLAGNLHLVTPSGPSARISFGLSNTVEMKVRSSADTTGVKKVKVIDNFSIDGYYNFLAERFKLSEIQLSLRSSIIKNFGLNISGTLDPYQVDENGNRIDKLMFSKGKIGRLSSASTSFGYSFNSSKMGGAINDANSGTRTTATDIPATNSFFDETGEEIDPATRRALMTSQYYDFSLPWNISFNGSLSYRNNGVKKNITPNLSFNGALTVTPKWGVTFSGGYDFKMKKLTPSMFTVNRDLHCWQMSFSWVPTGYRKSWSFNIHIKSSVLRDIKYDKQASYYDNIYY